MTSPAYTPAQRRLVRTAKQARKSTEERDEAIRFLHNKEGLTLRAIAELAGLSHTAVAKILAR